MVHHESRYFGGRRRLRYLALIATVVILPTIHFGSGRGAAWLARLLWEQEVAGSNPVAPNDVNVISKKS